MIEKDPLEKYITPDEAGKIVGLTGRRIRQLLSENDSVIEGRNLRGRWFVDRESVYKYLAQRDK